MRRGVFYDAGSCAGMLPLCGTAPRDFTGTSCRRGMSRMLNWSMAAESFGASARVSHCYERPCSRTGRTACFAMFPRAHS